MGLFKKTIVLFVIFILIAPGCAALGINKQKDEALKRTAKILCADPDETRMIIKGTKFENALDLTALCAS